MNSHILLPQTQGCYLFPCSWGFCLCVAHGGLVPAGNSVPFTPVFFLLSTRILSFVTTVVKPRAFVRYLIQHVVVWMRMAPVGSVSVFGPQLVELLGEDLRMWCCWRRCVLKWAKLSWSWCFIPALEQRPGHSIAHDWRAVSGVSQEFSFISNSCPSPVQAFHRVRYSRLHYFL